MKSRIILSSIVIFLFFISGCMTIPTEKLLQTNSQVKKIIEEYPDADLTSVMYSGENVRSLRNETLGLCGITLQGNSYYKITINDPTTNFHFIGYLNTETMNFECMKKFSATKDKFITETIETKKDKQESDIYVNENKQEDGVLLKLEGKYNHEYGRVILEWNKIDDPDLKYYKISHSPTDDSLKYPEKGYVEVTSKNEFIDNFNFKEGINYYRVTAVTLDDNIYSNVLKIYVKENPKKIDIEVEINNGASLAEVMIDGEKSIFTFYTVDESEIIDLIKKNTQLTYDEIKNNIGFHHYKEEEEDVEFDNVLEYEIEDDGIVLEWKPYPDVDDFKYYKVTHSTTNDDLKYPEDGYETAISDISKTRYLHHDFKEGVNYYRITTVLFDKRLYSDVVKVHIDKKVEGYYKEHENYDNDLYYEFDNESLKLYWNKYYDNSNFKYYKVVHSTTNPDLKYPDDGYIEVISDIDKSYHVTDNKEYFKKGVNYYRVTVVLDDNSKYHGNVVKLIVD